MNQSKLMKVINGNGKEIDLATTNPDTAPEGFAEALHQLLGIFARMRLEKNILAVWPLIATISERELQDFVETFKKHWHVRPDPRLGDNPDSPEPVDPRYVDLVPVPQALADKVCAGCSSGRFIARRMVICGNPKSEQSPYPLDPVFGWEHVPTPLSIGLEGGTETVEFLR